MADIFVTVGMPAGGPGAFAPPLTTLASPQQQQRIAQEQRTIDQSRELESRTRLLNDAFRQSTSLIQREISGARVGAAVAGMLGMPRGAGATTAFAAAALSHIIQSGRQTAEATVPTAFPGLGIQREYAERDRTAAIGRGLTGTFQAGTERARASADFWASSEGMGVTRTWSNLAQIPDKIVAALYRAFTPAGQGGRGQGIAPNPRAGQFFGSADELWRSTATAALQQSSPQGVLTEIRDELRRGKKPIVPGGGGLLTPTGADNPFMWLGNLFR